MPYFLTREQYAPDSLYITDASLDLVRQWCEATGERLRCYFVDGYVDPDDIEYADEYPAKYRLSAANITAAINAAQTRREAARMESERDREPKRVTIHHLETPEVIFRRASLNRVLQDLRRTPCPYPLETWKPIVGYTQEEEMKRFTIDFVNSPEGRALHESSIRFVDAVRRMYVRTQEEDQQ